MAQREFVTLVCLKAGLPYYEGDIFTVEKAVADALKAKDYKGDLRVRDYDEKKDTELLEVQRGKVGEVVED